VNCSPVLKWFIILALPLTLGLKLIVRPDTSAPSETDILQTVANFLVRQHFTVTLSDQPVGAKPTVLATAGACRMLIANSNPIAWDRDVIRRNATVADRVFVVFQGRTYKEQPTWLTVSYFLWSRLQRELGLRLQAAPLLAVIATASCDTDRLPWSEVS
jgi:hypothetical protein